MVSTDAAVALGRKQTISDQGAWAAALNRARTRDVGSLVAATVERVHREVENGSRIAYGWSGGKDSLALEHVMRLAGVEDCVLAMTSDLEWPAMLAWQTKHMPDGLTVQTVPLDLAWLASRPHMLFPQGSHGSAWFRLVQHKVQAAYFHGEGLDLLALGRRRADGNYIGPKGADRYTNRQGVTRWSPLHDWTHEDVLAVIVQNGMSLPPCYGWPRGFQVGTGPWPARQWTQSHDHGWTETWDIDPDVVRHAATLLPEAADWMRRAEVE